MEFRRYQKIHRFGAEENEGILDSGMCYVQEKVDGANTQIWMKDGKLCIGSRNQDLGDGSFNGFKQYVEEHFGIRAFFEANPNHRLYGEWLVRHTIAYKETSYKKFYLFDIEVDDRMLTTPEVYVLADLYKIETPKMFLAKECPTVEEIKSFVGQSELGEKGEGVVIKNPTFVNKFGSLEYAKIVTEQFKEDNAVVFGGNNKHSDSYWEMYVINKYMTLGRIQKIMNKIQPTIDERLDMKHIPRITNTAFHDMMTEEIWEIVSKVPALDFKKLQRLSMKKSKQIYVDILNDNISVADQE